MSDVDWKAMAILAGRKMRTRHGNLASCVHEFLALPATQQLSAQIIIPDCVKLDPGKAIRTVSGVALKTLALKIPVTGLTI